MFQSGSEGRAAQQCAVLTRLISPLLANIALSVLDEHFCAKWDAHRTSQRRDAHRKRGGATYRIVRSADDFVVLVAGTKTHADALWGAGDSPAGVAPVSRKVPGMPSRRGVRLPRVPHPAAPQKRNQQGQRLHLPVEEILAFDHGEGSGVDQQGTTSLPC